MSRKREKRVKVWASIDPDDALKLEILERRTQIPAGIHIRRAISDYVADVRAYEPDPDHPFRLDLYEHDTTSGGGQ